MAAADTMRDLWRLLVNERDPVVVPPDVVDTFIQRGLEALNRRAGYFWKDDTTTDSIAAGQQEYTLPLDCQEVVFVYLHGRRLEKADTQTLDDQYVDWRSKTGEPAEYALQGNRLLLVPVPGADSAAAGTDLLIRYIANPADFTTSGPDKLQAQDYPVPVYYAAHLWSASNPDSGLAVHRIEHLGGLFEKEAQIIAAQYGARRLERP